MKAPRILQLPALSHPPCGARGTGHKALPRLGSLGNCLYHSCCQSCSAKAEERRLQPPRVAMAVPRRGQLAGVCSLQAAT